MRREVLRLEQVTYKEKDVTLLQDFDLNIFEGEIMGLLPVDAFGLPALLQILKNYPQIYHGYIYYREKLVDSWVEERRSVNRITIIGDSSSLVEGQTVLTNVMILRRDYRQRIIHRKILFCQLRLFAERLGVSIDPMQLVDRLTPFERIAVEILRAAVADCRLIVLQEVSTIIGENELSRLYEIMHRCTKMGFAFLYISPHFEEHLQICDRTALMINRRIGKILRTEEMSEEIINKSCSAEYISRVQERLTQRKEYSRKIVFSVQNLTGHSFQNMNLKIRKGECLAIQCLDQKMQKEMLQLLLGLEEPLEGEFFLEGMPLTKTKQHQLAVINAQPWESMVYPDLSVYDNLCIGVDYRMPGVWNDRGIAKSIRGTIEEQMGVGIVDKQMSELSNRQKSELVYTRVLLQKPKLVFCIQPFKGEDISHRLLIWELQKRLLDRDIAVVIIAVNMADALSIADRVIRIDRSCGVMEYERSEFHKLPSTIPWYSLYQSME